MSSFQMLQTSFYKSLYLEHKMSFRLLCVSIKSVQQNGNVVSGGSCLLLILVNIREIHYAQFNVTAERDLHGPDHNSVLLRTQ